MRRLSAFLIVCSLFLLSGWTYEDCVEVDYDHPDCDRYTTTTTSTTVTTASTTTTTAPTSTTTTEPPVSSSSTTTTTEVEECPPGQIHQPPLCVTPPSSTAPPTLSPPEPQTPTEDTLPFTGPQVDPASALLAISVLLLAGLTALGFASRKASE